MLLLLLLLPLLGSVASGPYDPFNNSHGFYTPTPCDATIEDVIGSFHALIPGSENAYTQHDVYQSVAAFCPSTCLSNTSSHSTQRPAVYGSFPYHGRSSACLAAIHTGFINASVGGGFFISRFYRHDWSNSSTQTIFPHGSQHGTYSNGVQSQDIDSGWYTVPSNDTEYSYTLRVRGEYMLQRCQTPYPPRSNHLHLKRYLWTSPRYAVHIVIGGYNGIHYLNGVWAGVQLADDFSYSDLTWHRLDDAPFSPHSDMVESGDLIAGGSVVW